jgi:hypothetical protein
MQIGHGEPGKGKTRPYIVGFNKCTGFRTMQLICFPLRDNFLILQLNAVTESQFRTYYLFCCHLGLWGRYDIEKKDNESELREFWSSTCGEI